MEKGYRQILEHIKEHPPDYGDGDAHSILEMLYTSYHQYNRMDTEEIKKDFDRLYTDMTGLSLRDMDPIIDSVCCLVSGHQKSGFISGVKVGVMLAEEIK